MVTLQWASEVGRREKWLDRSFGIVSWVILGNISHARAECAGVLGYIWLSALFPQGVSSNSGFTYEELRAWSLLTSLAPICFAARHTSLAPLQFKRRRFPQEDSKRIRSYSQ